MKTETGLTCHIIFASLSLGAILVPGVGINAQEDFDSSEFQLHPACKIELVAKEPQVVDPIAARFDDRGRLWVVEMRDYPTLQGKVPQSKIKILQDRDQDGYFESATVFADQLMFPTGLQPWRQGVIVTLEGRVVYLADNDGDLRCDEEQLLFQGFAAQNTQLRANHPTLGPDGKIYIANGLRNGEISSPYSDEKLSLTGLDFRYDPSNLTFERITGHGQFGLTFDSAGNRYVCTNRNPLKRIVFEQSDLAVAKGVRVSQSVADVAAAGPDSRLYPISETWTTSNLHANQFTAACGVHLYDDFALGKEFRGNAFTCDPTANVVHREVIGFKEDSVIGRARPGREKIEFLASSKPEFRPVNLNSGPDGSLYVIDMRRSVIEHPQFMPPELKQRPDLRLGNQLGRIYRVTSQSSNAVFSDPEIQPAIHLFDSRSWWREQSHRLLVEDPAAADWDQILAGLGKQQSHPNGIIRALGLLRTHRKLRPVDLDFAISHYAASIRAFAMELCEGSRPEAIRAGVMDESDQVRFRALLSCAKSKAELSTSELATVAINGSQNSWIQQSLLIAAQDKRVELLDSLVRHVVQPVSTTRNENHVFQICHQLIPLALKTDPQKTQQMAELCLRHVADADLEKKDDSRTAKLEELAVAFLQQSVVRRKIFVGSSGFDSFLEPLRQRLRDRIKNSVSAERSRDGQEKNTVTRDLLLLALISQNDDLIREIAGQAKDPSVRIGALRALQHAYADEPWFDMVDQFRSLGFDSRVEVLKASQSRKKVATRLLNRIVDKKLRPTEIGPEFRARLNKHPDVETRQLAMRTLVTPVNADRQVAFAKYKIALELKADARRGKPLFAKNCATCHQLGDLGNRIGPDISDTRTKSKSQLLLDIIRPNAAIDNNYVEYLIATTTGKSLSGIMLENNATGVTLLQADNQQLVVPHEEIDQLQSTGKSLMPVGLEQELTVQQMADLISYLQNWRYLEQNIPYSENSNAK